ncbi:MAG: hypothetical protein K5694_03850 [Bacilli bacterium]|nr:hypothetical protein [Bacilli bacterium]
MHEILDDKVLYSGGRLNLTNETNLSKIITLYKASNTFKDPVKKLPSNDTYANFDKNIVYDVNEVETIGDYPPAYIFERNELELREKEIQKQIEAQKLAAEQKEKWKNIFKLVFLPMIIILAIGVGFAALSNFVLYKFLGADHTLIYIIISSVVFMLLGLLSYALTYVAKVAIFSAPPGYDKVKGLGQIFSGIGRIPLAVLMPFAFLNQIDKYFYYLIFFLSFFGLCFLLQFFGRRKETFYIQVLFETLVAAVIAPVVINHLVVTAKVATLLVTDAAYKMVTIEPLFFIFAGLLAISSYAVLNGTSSSNAGGFKVFFARATFLVYLPVVVALIGIAIAKWFSSFFFISQDYYDYNVGNLHVGAAVFWWHLPIYILAFAVVGLVKGLLDNLFFRVITQNPNLTPEHGFYQNTFTRLYVTIVSALMVAMFILGLYTNFHGISPSPLIALYTAIGVLPSILFMYIDENRSESFYFNGYLPLYPPTTFVAVGLLTPIILMEAINFVQYSAGYAAAAMVVFWALTYLKELVIAHTYY